MCAKATQRRLYVGLPNERTESSEKSHRHLASCMLLGILAQGRRPAGRDLHRRSCRAGPEPDEGACGQRHRGAAGRNRFADEEPAEENAPERLRKAGEETETEEETTGAEQAPENTAEVAVTLLTGLPLQGSRLHGKPERPRGTDPVRHAARLGGQ